MSFYIPPSIRTVKQDDQSSVVLTGGEVVPALIGLSNGRTQSVLATLMELGAATLFEIDDLRPAGPVAAITAIRSDLQGGIRYQDGIDYDFDDEAQTIQWNSVALAAPYITAIEDVTAASSSLSVGTTYYYVITALRVLNETGPVTGETVASNEISSSPIASTSRLKLTWRPVAGASGYKIYRSTVTGVYTGSHLLTTISDGFTTTYTDSGTSLSAGSPPGVEVNARTVADSDTPTTIATGSTFTIDIDGTPNATTLAGTRASRTGVGVSYPVTFNTGVNDTLTVKVTDGTGSYTTSITFAAGSTSLATVITQINGTPFTNGLAVDSGGQLKLQADHPGSAARLQIVGGTAVALLGHTVGTSSGTGDLPDFNDVSTQDLVDAIIALDSLDGATPEVDANTGRLAIVHDTAGSSHSLQPNADMNTLLDFSTTEVFGSDATSGTALRRPALNGGDFYVDYTYVSTDHFNFKKWTNLPKAIAEYGLGSTLATGLTLAMGTSGRGNGASQAVAASIPEDTIEGHQAALDLLMKRKDVTLVVPLSVVSGIGTAVKAHCIDASSVDNKRERRGILGTAIGTVVGDEDMTGSAVYQARQLNSERAILVHPWPFVRVQSADGSIAETELDGWASAAALAGRIASLGDRATSPTNKQIFGITRLGVDLEETEENTLGAAGVCVLTTEDGNIVCRDGVTTSLDDQPSSRIQIGLTDDLLRQTLRKQFKNFRGRKLTPDLLKSVSRKTAKILTLFKKLQLINDFDPASITAVQDADVLTNVDATFSYRPMFDVRIIEFRYSLDLSTGTIL